MAKDNTKTDEHVAVVLSEVAADLRGFLKSRRARKQRGLRWLEEKSGVSLGTLSRKLNRADQDLKLSTVVKVAHALDYRVKLSFEPMEEVENA